MSITSTFYTLIAVWCGYKSWKLNKLFKSRKGESNKKWMLEDLIFKQAGGTTLIFLSQLHMVFDISEEFSNNTYAVLALASVFTILVLVNYISLELLPNKSKNY
ncbi:hypothetical protein [Lacinutrix jangbogonensis]|uniref:hypothetical protein n=1 Tax=Lacinutrix jangbogonensis TaxID=1469557 RepID=UPI00053D75C6|nr:hypothetical protein [Lacinutrix jangbogonensis]